MPNVLARVRSRAVEKKTRDGGAGCAADVPGVRKGFPVGPSEIGEPPVPILREDSGGRMVNQGLSRIRDATLDFGLGALDPGRESIGMASLLNQVQVRRFILEKARAMRPYWPCTRVSEEGLMRIEADLRNRIERMIECHPTVGKTFRP